MTESIDTFNRLLTLAVENGASDIHIKSDKAAMLRLNGSLQSVDMDPLSGEMVSDFIETTCPEQFIENWHDDNQIDYSYSMDSLGRFRVNGFYQRGTISMVFHHVKDRPPTFDEMNHEEETLIQLCQHKEGIVLICGATGSGKSSCLACMLNWINHNMDKHIVTLEDPIEFTYTDVKSVFNQREVGIDSPSFELGMKAVLRQDPDIILIGELRDHDTFATALAAAETGHLVFGTLHSANAQQAVQRLFEFFPADQQENMRRQIAGALKATVSQRLVPDLDGSGRVPAQEIFIVDAMGRRVIEEGEYEKISSVIDAGSKESGSKSYNADLYRLIKAGMISKEDGLAFSPNAKSLEINLKGIFLSTGGIVS
jgi:twitching motility protein PilT